MKEIVRRLSLIFVVLSLLLSGVTIARALQPLTDTIQPVSVDTDSIKAFQERVTAWVKYYNRPDCSLRQSKLASCIIDDSLRTVTVEISGGFSEQFFTPDVTDTIYAHVKKMLPKDARSFELSIIAEGHPIEFLIPNHFRKGNKDKARLPREIYRGRPWVENVSRPYSISSGLEGNHIALWASHGRYAKSETEQWAWQRPMLFCTAEDVLSQSIVIPYIIPMLENAGAVVFTPRERDWQTNEVIVDNDNPNANGTYTETRRKANSSYLWGETPSLGFAHNKDIYLSCDSPFCDGTARFVPAVKNENDASFAKWKPAIPADGRYAVYVAYQSYENSVEDALYTVYHKGGLTEFRINQKMGGSTWVYLGTFDFAEGENDYGMVTLSNVCQTNGVVTADAVRFGGGMGNVITQISESDTTNVDDIGRRLTANVSKLPRWAEGAKYSTVWYGLPYYKNTEPFGINDYNNDINSRSASVNYLMGGSMYHPNAERGLRVPLDLTVAFHTDAGANRHDKFIGSLGIYKTDFNEGLTGAGLDRYVSRDLASVVLANLTTDLKKYNWQVRQLRNSNYGEAREPMTPAFILEMLSHQNFADMRMAYDPHFKFDFARSVYKSIVKFLATQHNRSYVIQPLPVTDFSISLNENRNEASLSWKPQNDPLEHTAKPTSYIVYTRRSGEGFDNGFIVNGTSCSVQLLPDELYSFKVAAINQGGESFPSEILSAGISSKNKGTVLVVNAFTRLEGPAEVDTPNECGFDLDADPGVQYGMFNGFCGRQLNFNRARFGKEGPEALGASSYELMTRPIMGNTFDYPAVHGEGIMWSDNHSFTSCSESAILNGYVKLDNYKFVDIIYGVQKNFNSKTSKLVSDYIGKGGKLIMSAANNGAPNIESERTGIIDDKKMEAVQGCGLTFSLFRDINELSYPVPTLTALTPLGTAFPILTYEDGSYAAVAKKSCFVRLGFPLESVRERDKMKQLMAAFLQFLE